MAKTRILNGGIELGLLQIAEESGIALSETDVLRKEYLENLPKGEWLTLGKEGMVEVDHD